MKVKEHQQVTGLVPDPADYARRTSLVGNHERWARHRIGAWRWPIVDKHRDRILELIQGNYTIDLGGLAGPVGYGTVVVDYQNPHDSPRSLWDVPPQADCVFCCHTLEHFTDLNNALASITNKLKRGGRLIVVVPSWRKTLLQDAFWPYHEHTFCESWEENAPAQFTRLDTLLAKGYELELVETFSDNIILIGAKR